MKRYVFLLMLILLAASVFGFGYIEDFIRASTQGATRIIERTPLYVLTWQHIVLSGVPTILALIVSLSIGSLIHYSENAELKSLALSMSAIGETFPSVAIIALSVPVLGYGNLPCMLALFVYALLPIIRNTITGLEEVDASAKDAAKGMGFSRIQTLLKVEMPLAYPTIIAGLKIALIINISAATLGATVGAGGLGVMIISGIRTYDTLKVLKGTLPVLFMALAADSALRTRSLISKH